MAQPELIKDIEARVKKSGDTMSNILHINTPDSLGIGLEITPVANSGEYGQINLNASLSVSNQNGIAIDNVGGAFRIYGIPSKDGTSKVGYGNTLQFDPYATGNSNVSFLLHSENFRQFLDNVYVDKNGSGATGLWNNGSKYAISVPEFDAIQTNIKTYLDNNNNIHKSGFQGELNLYRFFAAGDEGNYSSSYSLPCVDSHNLTFSINNNSDWIRVLSLDMRSNDIYTIGKFGGNWSSNWVKLLNSNNYNSYAPTLTGAGANGTWNISISGNSSTTNRLNKRAGNWYNASLGLNWYKYEQADMTVNQLPFNHVCIMTMMEGANRGFAIAGDWTGERKGMWMNQLHDDTASYKWGGWKRIWVEGNSVTGAVWNDYAEYRESDFIEPGYCLIENGNDTLSKSTERMQSWAGISSDTWGFAQGQTEKAQTPIAVAGRVLVYPYRDRNEYKSGDCVCTAPDGKVDIMTEEEIYKHPDKIIGVVSCVPDYEEWGGGENADRPPVKVNGRIWVRVK